MPLGVALAFGGAGVMDLAGNLGHQLVGLPAEVGAHDALVAGTVHDLAGRAPQAAFADEGEEPAFEMGVATAVDEHVVEEAGARASRSAEGGEPAAKESQGRETVSQRRVDGAAELGRGDLGGKVDDGAAGAGTGEAARRRPIDRGDHTGRVDVEVHAEPTPVARHEELDRPVGEALEPVECRGSPPRHEGPVAEFEEARPQRALPCRRRASHGEGGRPVPDQAAGLLPTSKLIGRIAERKHLGSVDHTVLAGGQRRDGSEIMHGVMCARAPADRNPTPFPGRSCRGFARKARESST